MKFFTKKLVGLSLASAFMLSACSPASPQLNPLPAVLKENVSQKPTDLVLFNPKVDILFVIDNSGSMSDTQRNLSRNAAEFSRAITGSTILDYHIGVTTTDMDTPCRKGCGNLVGKPLFVDKTTPNAADALAKNMLVGIDGSGSEKMFTPVVQALTVPNQGFYRQDAYLAVIFITDANEQSNMSAADLLKFLVNKKGDASMVLSYGVIRKLAEEYSCRGEENLDDKLETFLASVVNADKKQNNVLSLCEQNYGIKLAEFASDIVKRSSGTIRLQRIPNPKTITVTYGTQIIENNPINGWVYEVSTNSIILAAGIKFVDQGPSVGLSIDFETIEAK